MSWFALLTTAEWIIRLAMVPVILRRRFPTPTALAWLTVIFFVPEVGLLLYLLIGDYRIARRRLRRHQQVVMQLRSEQRAAETADHVIRPQLDPAHRSVVLQAERIGGMSILGGNSVDLLSQNQMIEGLIQDIDNAQHHVHLLFYIWEPDETGIRVAQALMNAVERGVACRVLVDAAGSYKLFARSNLPAQMTAHGIDIRQAMPVSLFSRRLARRMDLRNHRKLAVIDGQIAWSGSQNIVNPDIISRHYGIIRDLMGRFTGPIVTQLQLVFLEDWAYETGDELDQPGILPPPKRTGTIPAQAVPSGPSQDSRSLPRVLLAAINAAHRQIIISSPYLIPDEATALALSMASERGVEVDLVVPESSDHPLVSAATRAYFDSFLESGIRIHLYTRGVLHSKTMTVDDDLALLGTSNMDIRSFYLNFELNVLMYGPEIVRQLRDVQMRYMADSRVMSLDRWRARPRIVRYLQSAASLLSPLL